MFDSTFHMSTIDKMLLFEKRVLSNFSFYTTSNDEELNELFRIRYQVYCEEYHYLDEKDYKNQKETDEFDDHSFHLVVRHRSGILAATARLILDSQAGLPIEKHFRLKINISPESRNRIAEVSRLIVAKEFRRQHLLLVLIKGLYLLTKQKHINDIFAVLDDRLVPNLKEFKIPLTKIGEPTLYQGITAPYLIHINELEEVLRETNTPLNKFISNGYMETKGKDYQYTPH